jgi:UDP:flavonoid glycosyltransferase YjiC (YdhE family)
MHQEQAGNISLVKRQGAGLMLWKQELDKKHLASALEKLVTDFQFRENMKRLKLEQDQIDGATRAAQEIINFI